ncbi:MAG: serine/threonine-protein kinase [Sedimentisphaerales bacterium]
MFRLSRQISRPIIDAGNNYFGAELYEYFRKEVVLLGDMIVAFDPPLICEEVKASLGNLFDEIALLPCGGQGAVFRCTHRPSNQTVALKIYFTNQIQQRTQREIDLMKRIDNDALVRLVESGEIFIRNANCIFIATKFVQGNVLSNIIKQGKMGFPAVAKCGYDIAKAIQLLWAERIVHRDINPKNIMLTDKNSAVLIDLGVARHIDLDTLTAPGFSWGTIGYLSPEQARAVKQLSYKSDIFSLGITLQECLAGYHPVNHRQDLLVNGGQVRTNTLQDKLPKPMADIIDAMLRYRTYERPQFNDIFKILGSYI